MPRQFRFLGLSVAVVTLFGFNAFAEESPWVTSDQARARLVAGAAQSGHAEAMLEIQFSPGWHSYWKVPGDAGLPPKFEWAASENVDNVVVAWPTPRRIAELDMQTFGYQDGVTFPLAITQKDAAKAAKLNLKLDIMVCKDICTPQTLNLAMDVPQNGANGQVQVNHAKESLPAAESSDMKVDTVVAGPAGLAVAITSRAGLEDADVIATAGERVFTGKLEIKAAKDGHSAMVTIPKPADIKDLNAFLVGKSLEVIFTAHQKATVKTIQF